LFAGKNQLVTDIADQSQKGGFHIRRQGLIAKVAKTIVELVKILAQRRSGLEAQRPLADVLCLTEAAVLRQTGDSLLRSYNVSPFYEMYCMY